MNRTPWLVGDVQATADYLTQATDVYAAAFGMVQGITFTGLSADEQLRLIHGVIEALDLVLEATR
jgi:hypothetical protein